MANQQHFLIPPGPSQPFRPQTPVAHPGAYQTFSVAPWWRQASCAEIRCQHFEKGWITPIDETSELGRQQAGYIRHRSGRRFREISGDGRTEFQFYPGQTCFAAATHRVPAQRPELYVVGAGDWRAHVGRPHVYERADQWADDFHTHTNRIATARSRAGTAGD